MSGKHRYVPGAITITFGEVVENHARMEQIGDEIDNGYSCKQLKKIHKKLKNDGISSEIYDLGKYAGDYDLEDACILVVRNGVRSLGVKPDSLLLECFDKEWDKKAFMYGRVVNKKARWNVCMADYS